MSDQKTATVKFVVKIDEKTSADVHIEVYPKWAPIGAKRFLDLVKDKFFVDCRFHRVIPEFMCQFGIAGDPKHYKKWAQIKLKDDPVKVSNLRSHISFATSGPNARSTQLFINFVDNTGLDEQGFAPIGKVVKGMDIIDKVYAGYNESGKKPNQSSVKQFGNEYLDRHFPKLSTILSASILKSTSEISKA
ncbi:hypothetical protein AAMO2058_001048400 [Amorphochlora amoebiformis]